MSDDAPREVLSWEMFGDAGRELAQLVADSGYRPELILTIARGGLLPAGALGYALDVKNLVVVNVEFYVGVDERLDVPVMLPPVPAAVDLAGAGCCWSTTWPTPARRCGWCASSAVTTSRSAGPRCSTRSRARQ